MDNEKRYKVLLESYQKAYPDVLKQNQFKAAQREWNRVKNSPEDYEKFLLTLQAKAAKHKAATMSWWTQSKKQKAVWFV